MALVDAFTTDLLTGNAAGVLPDAAGLSDQQLQAIARELAASETAFILPSTEADRKLRSFTPREEVPICGHATIAAHALLHTDGALEAGTYSLETQVGVLDIEIEDDGTVWMTQNTPQVDTREVSYERLADVLGTDEATLQDVGADIPVARASTGLPVLIVPINFLESLGGLDPDFTALQQLSEEYDVAGIYVFTFDTLSGESTAHGRFFAPAVGIDEDPVTGTASGACAAYLDSVGSAAFDDLDDELRFEQGHFLDRGGVVRVQLETGDSGTQIWIGGHAVTSIEGTLTVPEDPDDDIIEA